MTAVELVLTADKLGIRIEARGSKLHVSAPSGVLTPELRDAFAVEKAALLSIYAPVTQYASLRGGLVVPAVALRLALSLEARGIGLDTGADGLIIVPDDPTLTAEDRAAIARWHRHLAAIVEYRADEIEHVQ